MPLQDPVLEQIAAAIKTRLETVTTANGYNYSLASVIRPPRYGPTTYANLTAVLMQEDPEVMGDDPYLEGNPVRVQFACMFIVYLFHLPSDTSTDAVDTVLNRLAADVTKAVMTDQTFGGLALPTTRVMPQQEFIPSQGAGCGVSVPIEVHYRVSELDPYVNGVS